MKVYITYTKDGYTGVAVDRVFLSLEKACQYIIDTKLKLNLHYSKMSPEELSFHATLHVEGFTVEE